MPITHNRKNYFFSVSFFPEVIICLPSPAAQHIGSKKKIPRPYDVLSLVFEYKKVIGHFSTYHWNDELDFHSIPFLCHVSPNSKQIKETIVLTSNCSTLSIWACGY